MSAQNIELLRPVYEEWERGNLRAGLELIDQDIESVWPPEFPSGGVYTGQSGHPRAMRDWLSPWEAFTLKAEGFHDAADRVVVPFIVHARGKESGVEVERKWAHVWTIRDGRAVRFEVSLRPDDAIESLGRAV